MTGATGTLIRAAGAKREGATMFFDKTISRPTRRQAPVPARRVVPLAALVAALALTACGGGSTATEPSTASSQATSTSAPGTTSTTAPVTTAPAPTTATTALATVDDLNKDLTDAIVATHPFTGPGDATCSATGTLRDWQPVYCGFNPYHPAEYGPVYVTVFDHHRYAWTVGHCCGSGPNPETYPIGLLCKDLLLPPPDTEPGRYPPEEDHLSYGLAVWYWLAEGRPDRMDVDHNGKPCETVYPASEVDAFWASTRQLP